MSEDFLNFLDEEIEFIERKLRLKAQGTIIEVSMRNYRWAKDRWPGRLIFVSTYEAIDTIFIRRRGFLHGSDKRQRRIKINPTLLEENLNNTELIKPEPVFDPGPRRGYYP